MPPLPDQIQQRPGHPHLLSDDATIISLCPDARYVSFWLAGSTRLVKKLERPAGQQFALSPRPFESAIAVGYVFQFSGRSREGLEDHAELHLRTRG